LRGNGRQGFPGWPTDERLEQLRSSGMPDAAGLVLASDQDDARAYAAIVERVTGEKPYLILSDDPKASAKIKPQIFFLQSSNEAVLFIDGCEQQIGEVSIDSYYIVLICRRLGNYLRSVGAT